MSSQSSAGNTPANLSPFPMVPDIWQKVASELALSPQQTRIVEQILHGRQDKEIAVELNLTVPTVRTYLKRIFDRTGVDDRLALVLHIFAIAQQLATSRCHRK